MTSDLPHVVFIMGPTASGKTDLAVYLNEHIDCEIISVDSALVYKGMDIGTAKPDKELLAQVPHRLIDICDPIESYSAARFLEDANLAVSEIIDKGKTPVLVGGTGLYFRALEKGLAELPDADQQIRVKLDSEAREYGWQHLHSRLKEIDPVAAERINENDPQRIQRALEVYEITGKTLTSLIAKENTGAFRYPIKKVVLSPTDRSVLHERIEKRFLTMLDAGLVDEVEFLFKRSDLSLDLPSMRLVGYRQVWQYLAGDYNYDEMKQKAVVATRQLAKRQITWCRSENDATWFDPCNLDIFPEILKFLDN